METHLARQVREIVAAMICGGGSGLVYDLIRGMTEKNKLSRLGELIWTVCTAFMLFAVGSTSGAGIRLFFLCATGAGFCLYRWALSPMVRGDLRRLQHDLHFYSGKNKNTAVSEAEQYKKTANM